MRKAGTALITFLGLALAAIPAMAEEGDAPVVIYEGLSLIDGTGAPLRENMSIVTRGDRIQLVAPVAEIPQDLKKSGEVVDARGKFAVPGLIDSHVHMATSPARRSAEALLRRQLYGGITAVRDMAGDVRALADLSRAALIQEIPAPDIHYVALMAGPTFFHDKRTVASAQGRTPGEVPWMQAVTDDTDLALAVARGQGTGASAIKIYANLPGPLVASITKAAHAQDFPVWTHAMVFPASPAEVVAAGVDVVSHACLLAYHLSGQKPGQYHDRIQPDYDKLEADGPEMRKLLRQMAEKGIILDATLRIYDLREKAQAADPDAPFPFHCPMRFAVPLMHAARDEGVEIAAGTDGRTPIDDPYPALHEELEILANTVGFPPLSVIRSATLVGAMALGLDEEMGTVEAGKLANFVLLEKNPVEDIGNLRSVTLTVKRGTRYPRADYRPIAPDEVKENF